MSQVKATQSRRLLVLGCVVFEWVKDEPLVSIEIPSGQLGDISREQWPALRAFLDMCFKEGD